jgi:glycosyltransferase involved in cell wall biosynthesis
LATASSRPDERSRPLKVLRIIARLNAGGPARHVTLLDRGLRDRGYRTLLAHGEVGPGEASLEHLARESGLPTVRIAELGARISAWSDLRAFAAILRVVFREQPDVIHTHTAKAGALGRLAAAAYNLRRPRARRALVVHTFHGHVLSGYFGRLASAAVRLAERALALLTDCIVTISPAQRADIVERFRIAPPSRVVVVPLGLDLQPLAAEPLPSTLRGVLAIHAGAVVFGYLGRFVPIKDLETLIDAFAIVAAAVPDAWLVLAGDGPLRPFLEQRAAQLTVAERVRFLGWTEALAEFYGAIDVCVLSSLNEGTPVALIEAMAAGKAVAATAVGGVPDVVDADRTGVLVRPHDAAALAAAMIRLARDGSLRERLGAAARASSLSRFSQDRLVDDVDRLYRERLVVKHRPLSPVN